VLRVVFDTNVYISALITPGGAAEKAYLSAINGNITLFTSISILTETAIKLREKFLWEDDRITTAIRHIGSAAHVLKPVIKLKILKDDPDNRILECAKEAKADLVVTGDRHLLQLKKFDTIKIVTIREFLDILKNRKIEGRFPHFQNPRIRKTNCPDGL